MPATINFDQEAARVIVREELEQLQQNIAANMTKAGEVASGRTIKSMHVETDVQQGTLFGRAFFGVLETGRSVGGIPRGFNQIIYQWMQDKNIHAAPMPYKTDRPHKYSDPQVRGDMSMASAIAWTIKTQGSSLFRKGGRDDIYSNEIPLTIKRIEGRLVFLITQAIRSIKLNNITIK